MPSSSFSALSAPSDDQLAQSQALVERLEVEIQTQGPMRFDQFMAQCLYAPGLGYYSGPSAKFGAEGDFITAPMQTPLFGSVLAKQCSQWLSQLNTNTILEFGAGDGQLAAQVLNQLERDNVDVDVDVDRELNYWILELSADLRIRQRNSIATLAPTALHRVKWLDTMPDEFEGVVIGNELIDAMPVRIFELQEQSVNEFKVVEKFVGSEKLDGKSAFVWVNQVADSAFSQIVLSDPTIPKVNNYCSEIGEQANGWVASMAKSLKRGVVLLIDYGFGSQEYFHPQRNAGTLRCHYRHHAHDDVFYLPGLQDITSHVNFSAIYAAAVESECELLGYTTQANFLMNLGILERLSELVADPMYLRHAQAVGRLVSEAEMGELFKVIAFAKLSEEQKEYLSQGFARGDRSHAL